MKINVSVVRKLVKEVLKEELFEIGTERPTVPAASSKGEQEFNQQMGGQKWGSPKSNALPKTNPNQKNSRVWSLVAGAGTMAKMDPEQRQAFQKEFSDFIAAKDPSEKLVMTAEDLADEFLKSRSSAEPAQSQPAG